MAHFLLILNIVRRKVLLYMQIGLPLTAVSQYPKSTYLMGIMYPCSQKPSHAPAKHTYLLLESRARTRHPLLGEAFRQRCKKGVDFSSSKKWAMNIYLQVFAWILTPVVSFMHTLWEKFLLKSSYAPVQLFPPTHPQLWHSLPPFPVPTPILERHRHAEQGTRVLRKKIILNFLISTN